MSIMLHVRVTFSTRLVHNRCAFGCSSMKALQGDEMLLLNLDLNDTATLMKEKNLLGDREQKH